MDTQFTFPPPPKPALRPAGRSASVGASGPRESSALRASVLDAALELGLVGNAGWMFDNPLQEENEEEDQTPSPGLTYGSSVTSEESIPSILSPASSSDAHTYANAAFPPSPSNRRLPPRANGYGAAAPPVPGLQRKDPVVRIVEPDFHHDRLDGAGAGGQPAGVPFPESSSSSSAPVRPTTPGGGRKLTKKKKAADGYESDGGYMSEAGKKKDKKKDKEKEKEKKSELGLMATAMPDVEAAGLAETSKEAKKRAKEEKKEAEVERKRTKSLLSSAAKAARKKDVANKDAGYATDGGGKAKAKPSKKNSADASGYDTDGTPAKKAKSRFFKLGKSASKTDLRAGAEAVPPLPFPAQREQDRRPCRCRLQSALRRPSARRFLVRRRARCPLRGAARHYR
ncbi:hypothetical protein BJ912DRAFT_187481 [Pholiota molesta]|nr:hypothetical protein BJ912DRAFT_187481 [Pholiota molesta]